ncbi:histidine phosphatase family protein [Actinoplanes sp. TBRC 11911]|uniref:histidine phosphatase family protein n=1 Tax=Actinoplanes sp. TBRC 11911 TaxID=2729386 RepID=UPI00145D0878|nr:histidine phosphatase family protein [Actinoplanes sp. TBRC 11911]NMO51041.1 histidine phosphatase family protein [Actinoplanes sp. TBRC 11911]
MPSTRLYLVRHGEQAPPAGHGPAAPPTGSGTPAVGGGLSAHGRAGSEPLAHGRAGGGLSALGREQADRLGRRLADVPFDAIHHSPLARAAETADIVATHLPQVPSHPCDHVTDRTPVPSADRRTDYPQRWHAWLDRVPPAERDENATYLRAAVEHFGATGDADRRHLLITHNFVIGWFVRHVLDAPDWRWLGLNQANAALTILEWNAARPPMLVAFNDTGHL